MREEIIVHTLLITRAGEHQYFQLDIPRDVIAITGVTSSVQLMQDVKATGTGQVGFLQFQATGKANGCYNTICKFESSQALKSDLSLTTYQAGFTKPTLLQKNGIAKRGMNSPETIFLPSCNCFYANYKDVLGETLAKDIAYRISITLWIQVNRK